MAHLGKNLTWIPSTHLSFVHQWTPTFQEVKQRKADPSNSLSRQPGWTNELQGSVKNSVSKIRWRQSRKTPTLTSELHMHKHTRAHTPFHAYTGVLTQTYMYYTQSWWRFSKQVVHLKGNMSLVIQANILATWYVAPLKLIKSEFYSIINEIQSNIV